MLSRDIRRIGMAQEFNAGEWIADGVLAALGQDPETSARGKRVLQCGGAVPASLPVTKILHQQKRTPLRATTRAP
jgi:hypothetical protein